MEIPSEIIKELEEKKARAVLAEREREASLAAVAVREAPARPEISFAPPPAKSSAPVMIEADPHRFSAGETLFELVAKAAVYLAVFLTPLFFMLSSESVSLSKQLLLGVLALVAATAWIGKMIVGGKFTWRKNFLMWPAALTAVAVILSALFSSTFWVSFLGDAGRVAFSAASLLAYLIILTVTLQTFTKKDLKISLALWLTAAFLAALTALLQFFGIFIFSRELYQVRSFNTVGSPFGLSVFLLSAIPFAVAVIQNRNSLAVKVLTAAAGAVILAAAAIVDFQLGWIALGLAILFLILMNFKKAAVDGVQSVSYQRNILMPLVMIIVAAVLWFASIPVKDLAMPTEVGPGYSLSWSVLKGSLKENPLFGSGPETYGYIYAKHKPASLNQTNIWGVNFSDSVAEVFTWTTTMGFFGLAALLFFAGGFLWFGFRRLSRDADARGWQAGLLASWVFILLSKFIYSTPLAVEFFFWLLPVFFVLASSDLEGELKSWWYFFQSGSTKTLVMFFALMVVLLGTVAGIYFSVRRWQAEINFARVLVLPNEAEKRDEAVKAVYDAVVANPYESRYFRVMAQVLFAKMNDVVSAIQARPQGQQTATAEESANLQNMTVQAISANQRAVLLDPQNASTLLNAAESYRGLAPLVQGADDLAIESYSKAIALDPINPFIRTQLAQTYLLKSGFFAGGVQKKEFVDQAKGVLEEALKLNPNYANGRYFMGLVYDAQGRQDLALAEFNELLKNNPDSEVIKKVVQNLQYGLPALGLPPQPATPPQPAPGALGTPEVPAR